jgi:hypothetical protein
MREEYGWVVNFEEPPYQSALDLGTFPWPAHPGATWRVVGGGSFQSNYTETPDMWSSPRLQLNVLEKVISDYNQSGNPGGFAVRTESDGKCTVVGVSMRDDSGRQVAVTPILDTPISLDTATRDAETTLRLITDALSRQTGVKVGIGFAPDNALMQSQVTVGGAALPARTLLLQTLDGAGGKMGWDLLYFPQFPHFVLNISIATRAQYDAFGNRRF